LGVERQEIMSDKLAIKAENALKAKAVELYQECVDSSNASTEVERQKCTEGVRDLLKFVTENSEDQRRAVMTFLSLKLSGFDPRGNPIFRLEDGTKESPIIIKK